jgi:hypothetical protein
MRADDDHNNYVRCENLDDLENHCGPLVLYNKEDKRWIKMRSLIQECCEYFGYLNVSIYNNDYMKYGDGIDEFLSGFWINLKDADYPDDDSSVNFGNAQVFIENGYMRVNLGSDYER